MIASKRYHGCFLLLVLVFFVVVSFGGSTLEDELLQPKENDGNREISQIRYFGRDSRQFLKNMVMGFLFAMSIVLIVWVL